jgi:hypothetical protein
MRVEWFPELDDLVRNSPPNMLVTVKTHDDFSSDDDSE